MDIKFEMWDKKNELMIEVDDIGMKGGILRQSMCCNDRKGKEWFFMDVGVCENGDRFVISCQKNWLEYYAKWLTKPSDVNRYKMLNFFNIKTATNLGSIFELQASGRT